MGNKVIMTEDPLQALERVKGRVDRLELARRITSAMVLLGSGDLSPQNQNFSTANSTTFVDVGVNVNFSLSRPARLLIPWSAPVTITAGSTFAYLTANIFQGVTFLGSADGGLIVDSRNLGYVSLYAPGSGALAAGDYTLHMQVATDTGVTLAVRSIHLEVYQLGTLDQ